MNAPRDGQECACPEHGSWIAADDVKRLTREIDVALNGEAGAAEQASLCDIAGQVVTAARARGAPLLAEAVGALTVENALVGTRAPAFGGGYWHKVEHGWKWCTGSTFPRPGGDWTGELIPPTNVAAQVAIHQLDTMRRIIDQAVAWTEARREEEKLPTDEDSNIEWPHFCRVGQMKNWSNAMQEAIRLLAGVAAQGAVAFRHRRRGSSGQWSYVDHRSPDSFELRECEIESLSRTHPQAAPAQGDDTRRLDWLGSNPRLAQIVIDGRATDCYYYAVSGAPGFTLREIIDAAMVAAAPSPEAG